MKRIITISFLLIALSLNNLGNAECRGGYELVGSYNAFVIIPSFGNYTSSYHSINIYRNCNGTQRYWAKNANQLYNIVINNSKRTYLGYDVSKYDYEVEVNGNFYFFNL